jgi:hypothetical protein
MTAFVEGLAQKIASETFPPACAATGAEIPIASMLAEPSTAARWRSGWLHSSGSTAIDVILFSMKSIPW